MKQNDSMIQERLTQKNNTEQHNNTMINKIVIQQQRANVNDAGQPSGTTLNNARK